MSFAKPGLCLAGDVHEVQAQAASIPSRSSAVLGRLGEAIAQVYLREVGYSIITTNYRCAGGELDVIAWDDDVLCFVEIRTRISSCYGDPLETIGRMKQRRLMRAAGHYVQHIVRPWPPMRFDAVGVLCPNAAAGPSTCTLVRDAFEA